MSRPLICMLLHNRYDMDARVKREARTFASRYRVRVVHLCGEVPTSGSALDAGVEVERIEVLSRSLPRSPVSWLF